MNISDLNYLETVSQATAIVGGGILDDLGLREELKQGGIAIGLADGSATALGDITFAATDTNVEAVAGVGVSAESNSVGVALNGPASD